jgi:hypothetical protein
MLWFVRLVTFMYSLLVVGLGNSGHDNLSTLQRAIFRRGIRQLQHIHQRVGCRLCHPMVQAWQLLVSCLIKWAQLTLCSQTSSSLRYKTQPPFGPYRSGLAAFFPGRLCSHFNSPLQQRPMMVLVRRDLPL